MTAPQHRRRVLVLRALGLGDLLTGVPALRGLRRAFPGDDIVLALPPALEQAALATGAVDTVLPAEAPGRGVPSLGHWPGPPPDLAVDLHGNGPASRDALAALRPGRLLAFAADPEPGLGRPPVWRPDEHERNRWCRFLGGYGIAADPDDVRLPAPATPSPAPGAVVVHPGAEAAARRWPAERYAVVVRHLRAAGHRVVLTGSPAEGALVRHIGEHAGLPPGDLLCGGLSFGELSALLAHASLVVSGDTGPAHLAVAHGTPSVTLFGPAVGTAAPRPPRRPVETRPTGRPARRTPRPPPAAHRTRRGHHHRTLPAPTRGGNNPSPEGS
ncbi:ADP-heptose:LPS heptosyltransferase [Streptomyces sp. SLBN-31]|nr:ADP-heptose:LPS heptosyltransferase [Streptomyces sp. SLBN-31]